MFLRLYTSVIPLMSEISVYKESCSTDLSPTALLSSRHRHARVQQTRGTRWGRGGVYPGWGYGWVGWVGTWEGYTGTPPGPLPGPIFSIYLRLRPTHGQMKAILSVLLRFPR